MANGLEMLANDLLFYITNIFSRMLCLFGMFQNVEMLVIIGEVNPYSIQFQIAYTFILGM